MFRFWGIWTIATAFLGLGIAQPTWSQENKSLPAAKADSTSRAVRARGVVYNDLNRNRVRDAGEPGLAGVRVSNGTDIVKTDAQGRYELTATDDTILFVIKPRNYMTHVNAQNLPQFYYVHKPAGSPKNFKYPGVAPTGPLPESIDFALYQRPEPDKFRALFFGDTQPRDVAEVEYMTHDVIEQVVANEAHQASFGVTLGDIVFDDLSVMDPHNQAIALIGLPWYNVLGNHDQNYEAADDSQSDETFERIYGPSYYSFDHGPTHFIVVDDVTWIAAKDGQKAKYVGGLGPEQMTFIRNDLAGIPEDQLVVLMMHIPLIEVLDRQDLYRLIEKRPAAISLSAHTHNMQHYFIGQEDGWMGPKKHHHIVNVTVCGSWWSGRKDERGIPHATMSDGGPNGYSIMEFDGASYSLQFRAAGRPAEYQMNIYAPESIKSSAASETQIVANVFNGNERCKCEMRLADADSQATSWTEMKPTTMADPALEAEIAKDLLDAGRKWRDLPKPHLTPHIWTAKLPASPKVGTQMIEVRVTFPDGKTHISRRGIAIQAD